MRVSNSLIFNNLMRDIGKYQTRMEDLRDQISTSKRVRRPSDDPLAGARAVALRALLARAEQHEANIEDARAWAFATEEALIRAKDLLLEARDIALRGANDTLSSDARNALAENIRELRDELFGLANSKHEDAYLFSGFKTDTEPFKEISPGTYIYQGDGGKKTIEIEPGITIKPDGTVRPCSTMEVSVPGKEAFESDGSNAFKVLFDLEEALRNGDTDAISAAIGEIDEKLDKILEHASGLGVKATHLDRAKARVVEDQTNLAALLSKAEDADIAKCAVTLALQEETYKNALAATARIVRPTLVDFLR